MLINNNIPTNRTWKLLKEERKLAYKFLLKQSKIADLTPIENLTLNQYFKIIKEALVALCDEDGNYLDLFDGKAPLYNLYTSSDEYILRRVMDGRSLFHSDYGDSYGLLNDIDHDDPHAFKDWVCNAKWGGHPFETSFGNFVPQCIYNDGYNFRARSKTKDINPKPLDEEFSNKWLLVFSTAHRNDEYAMRCFIHLRKLNYPVIWYVDDERDRKMLTKQYMVEKSKQPEWWDITISEIEKR